MKPGRRPDQPFGDGYPGLQRGGVHESRSARHCPSRRYRHHHRTPWQARHQQGWHAVCLPSSSQEGGIALAGVDHAGPRHVDGKVFRSFAVGRDITLSKLTEQQLLRRAQHDGLTGLANRACFDQSLDHASARAERNHHHLALLLIDLNGFKAVNDTHGHQAGDAVLATVAARLRSAQRKVTLVATGRRRTPRPDRRHERGGTGRGRQPHPDIVQQPISTGDCDVGVGCSIGIALTRGSQWR